MAQRILVIDDEPDLLELVRVNLRQAGFEVELAATGSEAIERLRRSPPDLILLDLMLPDLSGTEICRRIRANPDLAHVPIIMLTAKAAEIDRVVGLELGADDYVTKPFSPRELVLRVRAVLRRSEAQDEPSRVLERGGIRARSRAQALLCERRGGSAHHQGVRSAPAAHGPPGPRDDPRRTCWSRSGAPTSSSPPARSTPTSNGCERSSEMRVS